MKKIVIIEDDVVLSSGLEQLLRFEKYEVIKAYSGTEALLLLKTIKPDLILLDLNLPGMKGEEVLKTIKDVPVIILSAKTAVFDKVNNLRGGASDYITKPFNNDELLARIDVALRDSKKEESDLLIWKDITLDVLKHVVSVKQTEVKLTKTEFAILRLLMRRPKMVFSKRAIVDGISDYTLDGEESSISVHISSLRHKLSDKSDEEYIETIWGIGFKMKD